MPTKTSSWIIAGLGAGTVALILYLGSDRPPAAPSALDHAARACEALKRSGASACRYDLHLTEPNSIEATFAQLPAQPRHACAQAADQIRSTSAALRSDQTPWELRLFTHLSTRPVASCRI